MKGEMMTFRSGILPQFMRHALSRGTFVAAFGVLALLIGAVFLPIEQMKFYGPLLFLFAIGLITLGLLPYQRLKRLEENPYLLTLEGEEWLHFSAKGKMLFSIPIQTIDSTCFIDRKSIYGIAIFLKDPTKLVLQHPYFDLNVFCNKSLKSQNCDLFFPYFSLRTHEHLLEYLP